MKKLFAILQTVLGCDHMPGYWKASDGGVVVYECQKCRCLITSEMVLDLAPPHRTQDAKAPVETALERMERNWVRECGVAE